MLFYAKQHARIAAPVMLLLILIANGWASVRGIPLADMFKLNLPSLFAMPLGFVLVLSLDGVIYLANWIVGFRPFLGAFDRAMTQLFTRVSPAAIVTAGLLAAFGEETFFRGVLQHEIGLVPTAIVFALAHVGRGFNLFAVWGLLEGLVFGWLYQLTGNLLVPMFVHGLHDSLYMFVGRYLYKRWLPPAPTLADWLHTLNQSSAAPAHAPTTPKDGERLTGETTRDVVTTRPED